MGPVENPNRYLISYMLPGYKLLQLRETPFTFWWLYRIRWLLIILAGIPALTWSVYAIWRAWYIERQSKKKLELEVERQTRQIQHQKQEVEEKNLALQQEIEVHRHTQIKHREAITFLESLVDHSHEGIASINHEMKLLSANQRFYDMLDLPHDITGLPDDRASGLLPLANWIRDLLERRQGAQHVILELSTPESRRVMLQLHATYVRQNGRSHIIMHMQDISDLYMNPASGTDRTRYHTLIGIAPSMQKVFDQIDLYRDKDLTLLLTGETGVGKGEIARVLHATSTRARKPFHHFRCGLHRGRPLLFGTLRSSSRGLYRGGEGPCRVCGKCG
jgi:transcriptional regulator with PAS, ATPase and Fis domain